MLTLLRHRTFRNLFLAQVVALCGTGLATVALALLAYELAGSEAGAVLGTALAIKMVAYVTVAPLASAFLPMEYRKQALIVLDILRAVVAFSLPFVTQIWQIYILIFLLQASSASFTPVFQAIIPEILKNEDDYTQALSLSRLAYDLESLLSPALAAALLTVISFHGLFAGTGVGFIVSALLVAVTVLPVRASPPRHEGPYARAARGMRIYLSTPRLRGLLALTLVAAAGGAMVIVNTVVLVRAGMAGGEREVAWALMAFGGGSMAVALCLPRALRRFADRSIMIVASGVMTASLVVASVLYAAFDGVWGWWTLIPLWITLGSAYAGLVTPGGRLIRRSTDGAHMPELFAAQFSLSHVCWLVAYPLAGWLGARTGLGVALAVLSALAGSAAFAAMVLWRRRDEDIAGHDHGDLSPDHPHMVEHGSGPGHLHPRRADDLHRR